MLQRSLQGGLELAPAAGLRARGAASADLGLDLAAALQAIAADYAKTYPQLLGEIARLSFGRGRLSWEEYIALRLFDDAALAGVDKSAFVGIEGARRIWAMANYNSQWWGLMRDRLAVTALLGAHGLPVVPTLALYSDTICMRSIPVLRRPEALAAFLRASPEYPLVGTPTGWNTDSASSTLERYDSTRDAVITSRGGVVGIEQFTAEVAWRHKDGYLLQRRVTPHPEVRAVTGDRLAPVRVITIHGDKGPELLRTFWKIPAGTRPVGASWHDAGMFAKLNCQEGRIVRVIRGSGFSQEEMSHHPDTGAALEGVEVPNWKQIIGLALEAASAFREVRLIGWDIAPVDGGALIVNASFTPDFFVPQLVDRRGMLNRRFKAFLAGCKAQRRREIKADRLAQLSDLKNALCRMGQALALTSVGRAGFPETDCGYSAPAYWLDFHSSTR